MPLNSVYGAVLSRTIQYIYALTDIALAYHTYFLSSSKIFSSISAKTLKKFFALTIY